MDNISIRHLRLYSSTVPKQRPRPTQMSSIAPKFLFHGLVDVVKRFVILKFQEAAAHCEEPTGANKKKRKGLCGPSVFFINQIFQSKKKWKKHFSQESSMIFFLIMMASSSTEAWALPASTRHCLVSSSKVSMLSNSSFGRITVVGILLWHATKTWSCKHIVSSKWIQHSNDMTALIGRTTETQTWVVCMIVAHQHKPGLKNAPNTCRVVAFFHFV